MLLCGAPGSGKSSLASQLATSPPVEALREAHWRRSHARDIKKREAATTGKDEGGPSLSDPSEGSAKQNDPGDDPRGGPNAATRKALALRGDDPTVDDCKDVGGVVVIWLEVDALEETQTAAADEDHLPGALLTSLPGSSPLGSSPLGSSPVASSPFAASVWKAARRRAPQVVERLLQLHAAKRGARAAACCCCSNEISSSSSSSSNSSSSSGCCCCSLLLVVIDDTHHLRSLRKPFFQLARSCRAQNPKP